MKANIKFQAIRRRLLMRSSGDWLEKSNSNTSEFEQVSIFRLNLKKTLWEVGATFDITRPNDDGAWTTVERSAETLSYSKGIKCFFFAKICNDGFFLSLWAILLLRKAEVKFITGASFWSANEYSFGLDTIWLISDDFRECKLTLANSDKVGRDLEGLMFPMLILASWAIKFGFCSCDKVGFAKTWDGVFKDANWLRIGFSTDCFVLDKCSDANCPNKLGFLSIWELGLISYLMKHSGRISFRMDIKGATTDYERKTK